MYYITEIILRNNAKVDYYYFPSVSSDELGRTQCTVFSDKDNKYHIKLLKTLIESNEKVWGIYEEKDYSGISVFICTPQAIALKEHLELDIMETKSVDEKIVTLKHTTEYLASSLVNKIDYTDEVFILVNKSIVSIWQIIYNNFMMDNTVDMIINSEYIYYRKYDNDGTYFTSNVAFVFKKKPSFDTFLSKMLLELV